MQFLVFWGPNLPPTLFYYFPLLYVPFSLLCYVSHCFLSVFWTLIKCYWNTACTEKFANKSQWIFTNWTPNHLHIGKRKIARAPRGPPCTPCDSLISFWGWPRPDFSHCTWAVDTPVYLIIQTGSELGCGPVVEGSISLCFSFVVKREPPTNSSESGMLSPTQQQKMFENFLSAS